MNETKWPPNSCFFHTFLQPLQFINTRIPGQDNHMGLTQVLDCSNDGFLCQILDLTMIIRITITAPNLLVLTKYTIHPSYLIPSYLKEKPSHRPHQPLRSLLQTPIQQIEHGSVPPPCFARAQESTAFSSPAAASSHAPPYPPQLSSDSHSASSYPLPKSELNQVEWQC
jgi:hypothetical protein